jgi:hypothetical protein
LNRDRLKRLEAADMARFDAWLNAIPDVVLDQCVPAEAFDWLATHTDAELRQIIESGLEPPHIVAMMDEAVAKLLAARGPW